jgi:hypothetical protein
VIEHAHVVLLRSDDDDAIVFRRRSREKIVPLARIAVGARLVNARVAARLERRRQEDGGSDGSEGVGGGLEINETALRPLAG